MADLTVKTDGEKVLLKDGRGSIAFVVSNESDRDVTAEPSLVPLGETQADWLRLADGAQGANGGDVVLPPQGDHAFTVQVAPPSGAPASSYRFRFRVVDKYEPGAHWGESPEIGFDVPPPRVVERKRSPLWPFVVAALLLLIAVGTTIWLLTRKAVVPTMVGETPESAQVILAKASLKVGNKTDEANQDVTPGKIVRTAPGAGTKVARGTMVDLFVSSGPPIVVTPATPYLGNWIQDDGKPASETIPLASGPLTIRKENGFIIVEGSQSAGAPPGEIGRVPETDAQRGSIVLNWGYTRGTSISMFKLTLTPQSDGRLRSEAAVTTAPSFSAARQTKTYDDILKKRPLIRLLTPFNPATRPAPGAPSHW